MLVGREQELSVMNASFAEMLAGKGSVLFITGEAGLGKTTLVHEWRKNIEGQALYSEAACSIPIGNVDVGALEALQPWADVVIQLEAHPERSKKRLDLKKLIHEAAPAWASAIPFIGDIAHAAVETHRIVREQRNDANVNAQNQQQVFQQYVNLLSKVAEQSPLVVLLDDMHWADVSSTNLLFYLSRQITDKQILVLATYRPDDALSGQGGKRHPIIQIKNEILRYSAGKELSLHYLDRSAIRSILQSLFPEYETDDQLENWLRKISDGNSLFITQFIKTLSEDGHLDSRGAFIGDYDHITIPDSALAVVEERTMRLDDTTRELLSYATAEGEEFTSYILEQLTEKKPMQLLKELQQASQIGVIVEKGFGRMYSNQTTGIFGFSHALFHRALYESLLATQKNYLHRRCFELLKTEWDRPAAAKDRMVTLASKLLTHAEKCGECEAAAEVALAAAKSAWQNYAEAEAMEMLAHVKRMAETDPSELLALRMDALLLQANIHLVRGRYEESLTAAEQAKDCAEALFDDARTAAAMDRIGNVHSVRGAYDIALECYAACLNMNEALGNRAGIATSLNDIGRVHHNRSAFNEALEHHAKSLTIREEIRDHAGIAASLNNIGNVHSSRGAFGEALEYYSRGLKIAERSGDKPLHASLLANLGSAHSGLSEFHKALDFYAKSLVIREAIGDRAGIAMSLLGAGNVQENLGANEEALDCFAKSLAIQESIGNNAVIAWTQLHIGNVHMNKGDFDEAQEWFLKSLAMMETTGDRAGIATTLNNLGNMHRHRGANPEALEYYNRSLAIRDSIGDKLGVAWTLNNIGTTYRTMNDFTQARSYFSRVQEMSADLRSKLLLGDSLCELSLLCEAEAAQLGGAESEEKLNEAITRMEEGLGFLREINSGGAKKYEEELVRMKGN